MPFYQKRPVVIVAEEWDGKENEDVSLCSGFGYCAVCNGPLYEHGWISTLEGGHIVCPGDYIITGIRGEKYPCKPDIFHETYQKV